MKHDYMSQIIPNMRRIMHTYTSLTYILNSFHGKTNHANPTSISSSFQVVTYIIDTCPFV